MPPATGRSASVLIVPASQSLILTAYAQAAAQGLHSTVSRSSIGRPLLCLDLIFGKIRTVDATDNLCAI